MNADALAGLLQVRPGRPRPGNLGSTRRDWSGMLVRGRAANAVPGLLGCAFSLCGHAHRLCADLALRSAIGHESLRDETADRGLQVETLREHVRRVCLDWPERLATGGQRARFVDEGMSALRACPLWTAGAESSVASTCDWLEARLLGMPARDWLAAWEARPATWWADWSETFDGWLPRLMRACRPSADWSMRPAARLHVHAADETLRPLAEAMSSDDDFARCPRWRGACAETGPWARLNDDARDGPPSTITPWLRLGDRVAELVRLALPDAPRRSGAGWLAGGALRIAANRGLGWVETARGLLVHHAVIESSTPEARVAAYQVLAPTEWNFHPQGAVAQALESMGPPHEAAIDDRVAALMTAYDPCVRYEVSEQRDREGATHA